jgi:hypothetical protein
MKLRSEEPVPAFVLRRQAAIRIEVAAAAAETPVATERLRGMAKRTLKRLDTGGNHSAVPER